MCKQCDRTPVPGEKRRHVDLVEVGHVSLQVHGCQVSISVNHGHGWMDFLKVNLMTARRRLVFVRAGRGMAHVVENARREPRGTNSSSMVSCGGSGSSRPSPIISQVKLLSALSNPIEDIWVLKLKSSTAAPGWGDSPLKRQRSVSRSLAMAIEGFATLRLGGKAAVWF